MPDLTNRRLAILNSAKDNDVVSMPYMTGFERVSWLRNAEYLVTCGLLRPNAHGDWYITDAGRAALTPQQGEP